MNLSNEYNSKKKTRSLVSFFLDQQQISDPKSIFPVQPSIDTDLSQQKRDPTLTYYRGESIVPNQGRTTQSVMKSPTYYDTQTKAPQNSMYHQHADGYLELFDELINQNNACFGFSLSHIPSKYCLYMTIITFLGICLIISLIAILKT